MGMQCFSHCVYLLLDILLLIGFFIVAVVDVKETLFRI